MQFLDNWRPRVETTGDGDSGSYVAAGVWLLVVAQGRDMGMYEGEIMTACIYIRKYVSICDGHLKICNADNIRLFRK